MMVRFAILPMCRGIFYTLSVWLSRLPWLSAALSTRLRLLLLGLLLRFLLTGLWLVFTISLAAR